MSSSDSPDRPGERSGAGTGPRPAALLRVRISPDDVGARVSIRHRLDATTLTDVVGHLDSWADGVLVVRRRDGRTMTVAEAALVAGKVVPEAPQRR